MRSLTDEQRARITTSIDLGSGQQLVLLNVAGEKGLPASGANRNIYRIGPSGHVEWQIESSGTIYSQGSFVSLSRLPSGDIHARRFFGNEFTVDPANGKLTQVGLAK